MESGVKLQLLQTKVKKSIEVMYEIIVFRLIDCWY